MSWVIVYIYISTSTCPTMVISYMLTCYNFGYICIFRIPQASGLRGNFIIKFCSVLSNELVHVKEVLALTRLAYQSDLLSIRIL